MPERLCSECGVMSVRSSDPNTTWCRDCRRDKEEEVKLALSILIVTNPEKAKKIMDDYPQVFGGKEVVN